MKWPNDVMSPVGKLAGILVETKSTWLGYLHVVIGIGINIHNASAVKGRVEQPVADQKLDATFAYLDRRNHDNAPGAAFA